MQRRTTEYQHRVREVTSGVNVLVEHPEPARLFIRRMDVVVIDRVDHQSARGVRVIRRIAEPHHVLFIERLDFSREQRVVADKYLFAHE